MATPVYSRGQSSCVTQRQLSPAQRATAPNSPSASGATLRVDLVSEARHAGCSWGLKGEEDEGEATARETLAMVVEIARDIDDGKL